MMTTQIALAAPRSRNGNGRHWVYQDADVLADTISDIRRRFGDGAIFRLGETSHLYCKAISTGIPALDAALGVGGLPRGRIVDIFGPEQSGKTTLCLMVIAQAQAMGGQAIFISTDNGFDSRWAARWGVDVDNLYLAQPDCGEQALEIADVMTRAGAGVVVIDSAAALTPRAEMRGDMGDCHINYGAMMSQAMRKLAGAARKSGTLAIFTNQLRITGPDFASRETATGGRALRFYAAVRLDVRRIMAIKSGGQIVGTRHRAVVKKNKVAPPFGQCEFDILTEGRR